MLLAVVLATGHGGAWAARAACLVGDASQVARDAGQIRALRADIDAACPCAAFDGSPGNTHGRYLACARARVAAAIAVASLRSRCRGTVLRTYAKSTCGHDPLRHRAPCVRTSRRSGRVSCAIVATTARDGVTPQRRCESSPQSVRALCLVATTCLDAADVDDDLLIGPADGGRCRGVAGCGNGVREGAESCDPPDDAACAGLCQIDCTCAPACGDAGAPECEGSCPPGDWCRPAGGDGCACSPATLGCAFLQVALDPYCNGECPAERPLCRTVGDHCECTTERTPCVDSAGPSCSGVCPPGLECGWTDFLGEGIGARGCGCVPPGATACGFASQPICNGACPSGQQCLDLPEWFCGCVPDDVQCGDLQAQFCAVGPCQAGQTCQALAGGGCGCFAGPPPCAQAPAPQCGGTCPAGEVCADAAGTGCACFPDPPTCGGALETCGLGQCPAGYFCASSGGFLPDPCFCVPDGTELCGATPFPVCGGLCPVGSCVAHALGFCTCL